MWHLLDPCVIQIPGGESVRPAHRYHEFDEFIYILSGRGFIEINDKSYEVKEGTGILVETEEKHSLSNTGTTPLEALCVFVPACTVESYIVTD